MEENKNELKKGQWVYWKFLDGKTFAKSCIQDLVKTQSGNLLELSDSGLGTNYPNRVLESDIILLTEIK